MFSQLPIILSQSHVHLVGFVPSKTKLGRGFFHNLIQKSDDCGVGNGRCTCY
jgi:hypothetical protein